jgi:hypothetical protein
LSKSSTQGYLLDEIQAREQFYGDRMLWIFDATAAQITVWAALPVLANTPCRCTHDQCSKIWLSPGVVCRCQHEGCTGYMRERQWKPSPDVWFRWKHARASLVACRRPVLLDLGNGSVLRIGPWPPFIPSIGMTGALYTRASIEDWLRDGTKWERMILPPVAPLSRYDPPSWERYRNPGAWQAYQEQARWWIFGADVPQP